MLDLIKVRRKPMGTQLSKHLLNSEIYPVKWPSVRLSSRYTPVTKEFSRLTVAAASGLI